MDFESIKPVGDFNVTIDHLREQVDRISKLPDPPDAITEAIYQSTVAMYEVGAAIAERIERIEQYGLP